MIQKINVAKLLKDCPKGMELDCTICNNLKFIRLDISPNFPIVVRNNGYEFSLTKYGQVHNIDDSKCVIFPKGKTTWEGFQRPFVDGDVISDSLGTCIFKGEGGIKGTVNYYCGISDGYFRVKDDKRDPDGHYGDIVDFRLATEEEKQKLFNAIKEHGFKWDAETKTLEIVKSKFETGDVITYKQNNVSFTAILDKFVNFVEIHYYCALCEDSKTLITNDFFVGAIDDIRHATEEEKQKLFDVIRENGYKWNDYKLVSDKFDISTLIPFESRVLVRNYGDNIWKPATFGCFNNNFFYVLGGNAYKQCIPYEGNEHLRGNTNDCAEYYKTWE